MIINVIYTALYIYKSSKIQMVSLKKNILIASKHIFLLAIFTLQKQTTKINKLYLLSKAKNQLDIISILAKCVILLDH